MKKKVSLLLPIFLGSFTFAQQTTASPVVSQLSDDQKASYYIGLNIAKSMKADGLNLDVDLLAKAMKDEFSGNPKLLPESEMNTFMQAFGQKLNERKAEQQKKASEENKKRGREFLAENKKNAKIKTTASGLQYEILKEGDKGMKPKATDLVSVLYTGKLLDGTVFDSTDKNGGKPIEIPLSGVIKGWTEGIQLMSKGAAYRFYIPAELAYDERGAGNAIPPGSTLLFDVELVNFKENTPPSIPTPIDAK